MSNGEQRYNMVLKNTARHLGQRDLERRKHE
jgi:hypothetical protein